MRDDASEQPDADGKMAGDRRMRRSSLMGRHTHCTTNGVTLNIWMRSGRFIARGYCNRECFGETLGATVSEAEARLRQMMTEIENDTYVRASQRRQQMISITRTPNLSPRELVNLFLVDTRKLKGEKTAATYRSRLMPLLEFLETDGRQRRWPLAAKLSGDRAFATDLRAWLHQRKVRRNGRPGCLPTMISPRQIVNILTTVRTLLTWGSSREVNLLPPGFISPLTPQIVGEKAQKDPLRGQTFPMDMRIEMVKVMDAWQLCTLSFLFILPPRPEEFAGLLLSDTRPDPRRLVFGTRLSGDDFNKARLSFQNPYPWQFDPLIRFWQRSRSAGPLFLRRSIVEGKRRAIDVHDDQEVFDRYRSYVATLAPEKIQTEQDRKDAFRRVLARLGGVDGDDLREEFRAVYTTVRPGVAPRFYDLRGDVSMDLRRAGVEDMLRKYLRGQTISGDIASVYEGMDLDAEMQPYFKMISPLLDAIATRAKELGLK